MTDWTYGSAGAAEASARKEVIAMERVKLFILLLELRVLALCQTGAAFYLRTVIQNDALGFLNQGSFQLRPEKAVIVSAQVRFSLSGRLSIGV